MRLHISSRRRRGMTLGEVMVAATITLLVLGLLGGFARFNQFAWQDGMSNTGAQLATEMALNRMAQTIREARSVVAGSSSSTRVTLQMPSYNTDGSLVVPLTNGQQISYYLSNTTGSVSSPGNILWRSVNGTADSGWSRTNSTTGRVILASGGLALTYSPSLGAAGGPESVIVSLTASRTFGSKTNTITTSQEIMLRNRGL